MIGLDFVWFTWILSELGYHLVGLRARHQLLEFSSTKLFLDILAIVCPFIQSHHFLSF
jgi:hypothetical protein